MNDLRLPVVPVPGLRTGLDQVELDAFERSLRVGGEPMKRRIYTAEELSYADGRVDRLAARFAAKEAALKMLGTGARGISLREIEVVHQATGEPQLVLVARAAARATELMLAGWGVSLSHSKASAAAIVIGWPASLAVCA